MKFKERLQYLRLEKDLSEIQLSQKVGISESVIRLYERGKLSIDLEHLQKLACFFDVTPGLLLGTAFPHLPPEEAVESHRVVNELLEIRNEERQREQDSLFYIDTLTQLAAKPTSKAPNWQSVLRAGVVAVFNNIVSSDSEANQEFIEDYWPVNNTVMQIYGNDLINYFYYRVNGDFMEPTIKSQSIVLVKRQVPVDNNDLAVVLLEQGPAVVKRLNRYEDKLILLSDNKAYPAQIYEQNNCIILGKVLWKPK
ncbi:MAG: XRE family transcriptional regulator [Syntrophomonas sp.]|uniref:helix-turn-helix domain-containing protein n=1 Tax=Syntrophomonas sp. TaxID=2053627 RepID=UPI00260FF8AE|nr:XRE family transcriptional regulator [Syntrophomonas sp.]MDD2510268.1 XRE family transcriptional regulator [Syntrophomonas sp.]MDD3879283.1 XRE family transcriptional regulator [Syntrophomonas sp.]MDD4627027.1 XRE family transcriptional regulator [Syntrophomonas sp.]